MTTTQPNPASTPTRVRGDAFVMFAYDLGLTIDLDRATALLADATRRKAVRHRRRAPSWFEYEPTPLRVTREAAPIGVGSLRTEPAVECTLYDFGAVSVLYRIPVECPIDDLPSLSEQLYESPALLQDSRSRAESLLADIRAGVSKPGLRAVVEDYVVFALREWDAPPGETAESVVDRHAAGVAGALHAESGDLSGSLVREAVANRLCFAPTDAAVIGWNAAVLLDAQPEDLLVLLEHANVELLEMRVLDEYLDSLLERSAALLERESKRRHWPLGPSARDLQALAEVQTDSSIMFEGVNNALKLIGDQHLARVYRLASETMHLPDWDAAVLRKLATTESVFEKIATYQSAKRMELLEVIIVLLIAVSIVLPFLPIYSGGK
ncbi:MAG: hypothetical protein KF684_12565 [Phycisphaeraceae bacterium]|nr:hypothetical protein [Phycisphaeraceae bacterium]